MSDLLAEFPDLLGVLHVLVVSLKNQLSQRPRHGWLVLIGDDLTRLRDRVMKLQKHFGDVNEDVRQILISADKIEKRAGRIEELDFSKEPAETPRLVKGAAELFPLPSRKLQAGE